MARDKAHRPQPPSNVHVRRALHLARAQELRDRKRLRLQRHMTQEVTRAMSLTDDQLLEDLGGALEAGGSITWTENGRASPPLPYTASAAQVEAARMALYELEDASQRDERARLTYRAADRKVEGEGWLVEELAEDGTLVGSAYEISRDRARKLARDRNEQS